MPSQKSLKIYSSLRSNSRKKLTQISKETQIPVSTIFDLIKGSQIIKKFTALLDFNQLGYSVKVQILLQTSEEEEILTFLKRSFNVNRVYRLNEKFNILLEGYFKSLLEVDSFTRLLSKKFKIKDKKIIYLIEEIITEKFFSDPNLINLAM
jgi:DNA-binding Lrp family transcriptional regulator